MTRQGEPDGPPSRAVAQRGRPPRRRLAAGLAVCALLLAGCSDVLLLELPAVDHLRDSPAAVPLPSLVFAADGTQLAELRREYREPVTLADVPRHVVDAVLTAEDRRFFEHDGVDARALARAAIRNVVAGEVEQGGSTITQQLVKLLYMPDAPRTPETKLQEALLARQLEAERSKASLLTEYLNLVYFGGGAHGIGAAAWTYFRAEVADLTVDQGALLAAIIRAPEALAPGRNPEGARSRRDDVLWRMEAEGFLTGEQRAFAVAVPLEVFARPPAPETREPHLVDLVTRTLLEDVRFGATAEERAARLYGGGLRIHTTVHLEAQAAARAVIAEHLSDPGVPDAAIAAVDPRTGHVVALAGSRPYDELQFDLPTQARRQPGSTFKTFVLAAAIADGWRPDSRLDGRQGTVVTSVGRWEVANYDRNDYPAVTLSGATRASINAAYARLGGEVGLDRVAALATAMGVRSAVPHDDPQIAIGGGTLGVTPLDLAAAYGTIGNLGVHVPTTVIDRIEDEQGTVVWLPDTTPRAAVTPDVAYVTAGVLTEVVERGTGLAARVPGWEIAGKTGTTSDYADAWFVGTTPVLSTAVWMGHLEGRIPMTQVQGVRRVTGGSLPARMFADVMTRLLADVTPVGFVLPRDAARIVEIDPVTGLLAAPWCPGEAQRLPLILIPTDTCPEPPPPAPVPEPAPPATQDHSPEDDGLPDDEVPQDGADPTAPPPGTEPDGPPVNGDPDGGDEPGEGEVRPPPDDGTPDANGGATGGE